MGTHSVALANCDALLHVLVEENLSSALRVICHMHFRTERISPPPIVNLMDSARDRLDSSRLLDLGQGLSGHIPPKESLDAVSARLMHPSTHRYTSDQGLIELREELSLYLRKRHGIRSDPTEEIVITAGANQAFAGTAMTLVGPGENVIMPGPYYFNSVMSVQLCGGVVKEVPVDRRFQPVPDSIRRAVDKRTRAVLLVSPNNPTGAVYDRDVVDDIVEICIDNDLMLISDETYARMVFDGSSHYSPMSRKSASGHLVTIGSFSKEFGMSGWRVGYVVGSSEFIKEYMKVQDTIVICAPTAGQMLALEILKNRTDVLDEEMERLGQIRELAYRRCREIGELETVTTSGTFYLFPRVLGCSDSRSFVLDLLRHQDLLLMPGSIFGQYGECFVRLSIGPLTPEAVDEAFDRLSKYFGST